MIKKVTILSFVSIILLFFSPYVYADQVVPSDRVEDHVNVRSHSNSQSDAVGTLRKNETAELIESVPYWHKVKLVDDTEGLP